MRILLKSVEIVNPSINDLTPSRTNILIEDGIISEINTQITEAEVIVESNDLKVSIGWVDMNALIGEPGLEFKEDLESATQAALKGGFTEVACLPNTNPVIQDKNLISFYKTKGGLVKFHPIGAVTNNNLGLELTEMLDMHEAGAVAFSDGTKSLNNPEMITKALMYLSKIDGLLINKPEENSISHGGVMHEGITSTFLGLKGMPDLAEELAVMRDLKLLEYYGGKIHFSNISTAKSVELIREAKREGLNVTCDIASHQVAFEDNILKNFDTNYKVNPPFRTQQDIEELWKGLKDQTIDAIVSAHRPQDEESKKLEFDLAEFGIIGLETAFSVINTLNKGLKLSEIINKLTYSPRKILKLSLPEIKVGEVANLTVFDPTLRWSLKEKDIQSKSKNSPFIDFDFIGKPLAVFNNKQHFINRNP